MAVDVAELVANVIVEEGIDALFSEICRTKKAASRTDGDIG